MGRAIDAQTVLPFSSQGGGVRCGLVFSRSTLRLPCKSVACPSKFALSHPHFCWRGAMVYSKLTSVPEIL